VLVAAGGGAREAHCVFHMALHPRHGTDAADGAKGGMKNREYGRLLDSYNVGNMLGEGTFGIVFACKPIGQETDCAVKIVSKVEAPFDKIKQEAWLLQKMNHPNVIKCYDVIYQKHAVCIVMERLRGGNLIQAMERHWESKGNFPAMSTIHLCSQMASSMHYLHERSIIHRDVKGDNFLCDRTSIEDPQCRIVLGDFGTVARGSATERLRGKCGTRLYWSPEFYKFDYSFKVDIWAMGVTLFVLIYGRFPFRDERDVATKIVRHSKGTPTECQDFLDSMLEKEEEKRADSAQVLAHPWIAGWRCNEVQHDKGRLCTYSDDSDSEVSTQIPDDVSSRSFENASSEIPCGF